MTSQPDDDPTLAGAQVPSPGAGGSEDLTVPSGSPAAADDKTVPAMSAAALGAGTGPGHLIGKVVGGCRIDTVLGRGAMGAVYKAKQIKLDRDVAVKVIRPEMMADTRMLKRFEIEARTVGRFNSAHVVMVHDVGFELGVHYLVMEFVQGKNLREHVKLLAGGRLPAGEALGLIRQAVKGLDEARRLGVVHRDIKPDNLMLTDQGVLKIADFGIAKPIEADFSMTMTSELIGTPLYMSPEQCQGGADVDFRSDMYSLGATFFYLLTGEPPIRASSVYELIQTKTKLENLCLWKALPGLDENNPLSRVIERMTANDREDRYASYEELLNDLVLVEAGETISVKPKRPKPVGARGARAGAAPAKKGNGLVTAVAALVVLGAAGGGYWFFSGGGAASAGGGASVEAAAVPSIDTARQALQRFRARLADSGPGSTLREELRALAVPAALGAERERLLADVDAGLAVETRVSALAEPAMQPPFAELAGYLAAADAALAVGDDAGAELRRWAERRREAVRDGEFGPAARAALLEAFGQWQQELERAGGDTDARARLVGRLDEIDRGRLLLRDQFPKQRDALDRAMPASRIDEARRRLDEPAKAMPDADVGSALAEIRAQFVAEGPKDSLRTRLRDLQPTSEAQTRERKDLLDAIDVARNAEQQVRLKAAPTTPKPPFDDVVGYYREIDRALAPLRKDDALPPWADALRRELRAEEQLQAAVTTAVQDLWTTWQEQRRSGAAVGELDRGMRAIGAATARAIELFPAAKDALSAAVPQQQLDAEMEAVRLETRRLEWRRQLAAASARLTALGGVADFRAAEAALDADAKALADGLAALPADATATGERNDLAAAIERWRVASRRLDEFARAFAAADLSGAATGLRVALGSAEGKSDFERLQPIVSGCVEAFEQLGSTLDVPAAKAKLTAARDAARGLTVLPGEVVTRIETWLSGVEKLGRAAAGMVPIAAGTARDPAQPVAAFFLGATEVSQREWAAFQGELRAAAQGDGDDQRFQAVAPRLEGSGMDARRLAALLQRPLTSDEDRPIDRVTWFEAMAYCRFHGKDLPTAAEWSLAAFGDGGARRFPWGDAWSNDKAQRNPSTQLLAGVADGGLSWRSQGGPRLHHLAGNVAEWLAADVAAGSADTAGGRYNLRGMASMEDAAAGKLERRRMDDSMGGIGFRTVLRPREFGALTWPR